MNWYSKYFLPKMLDRTMSGDFFDDARKVYVPRASGVVLEIGAGSATNVPFYTNAVTKLYALEPSQELWDLGKERVAQAAFPVEHLRAPAEQVPLADASVDTVLSTYMLCSVNDPRAVLHEVRRVLKPGGSFVFVDHGLAPSGIRKIAQMVVNPFSITFAGNCHVTRKIDDLVREAGFTIDGLDNAYDRPLIYVYRGVAK